MTTENNSETPVSAHRLDARVDTYPRRQLSVSWPEPMHGVLRIVIDRIAEEGGGRTSQQEVLAALVLDASLRDPNEIIELLRSFRQTTVQDLPYTNTL